MYSRLIQPPPKSFFLFGPRGVGKTTWVKSSFPRALYIDLLEAKLFNTLLANPQRLENLIPSNFKEWVIIDEVQRIPEILNEAHRLIEKSGFKFILTSSSLLKLRRTGPNLLARPRVFLLLKTVSQILVFFARFFEVLVKYRLKRR